MKQISVESAAQIIGVSSATLRNWAKAGHIRPVSIRPIAFSEEDVSDLRNKIRTESFSKLKTRANKAGSVSVFQPEEYSEDPHLVSQVALIGNCIRQNRLEIASVMFLAATRLLETTGSVTKADNRNVFDLDAYKHWSSECLRAVMNEWRDLLKEQIDEALYRQLLEMLVPCAADDYLGFLYQSIVREGEKSEQGSYYTPSALVEDSLAWIQEPIESFLDPCCGTGKYLLIAAKRFRLDPDKIFGFDSDRIAVMIAKINLLLAFDGKAFLPNIFCIDSLSELASGDLFCETNDLLGKIDAIATNPPWGAYKNSDRKLQVSGKVRSGETFSLFLEKSIQLLREGGQLSFILPESILKIRIHSDIREVILRSTKIKEITMLGRQFTGVFTPVVRLDLIKEHASKDWLVSLKQGGKCNQVEQSRFESNDNFTFDVSTETHEAELITKIYSKKHTTLVSNAEWALGIVTGNNKNYVLEFQEDGAEAILRGSDVFQFSLNDPTSFIRFAPKDFQQVAPERLFRAPEKLIYRFISKKLIFAYDDKQRLTLNSANILIPSIPGMSTKVVLAFLNSAVFQYIFEKKFSTHKVLRGDLEKLPFPGLEPEMHLAIERQVDKAMHGREMPSELDSLIFLAFDLSQTEIEQIRLTRGD